MYKKLVVHALSTTGFFLSTFLHQKLYTTQIWQFLALDSFFLNFGSFVMEFWNFALEFWCTVLLSNIGTLLILYFCF